MAKSRRRTFRFHHGSKFDFSTFDSIKVDPKTVPQRIVTDTPKELPPEPPKERCKTKSEAWGFLTRKG